ncbi:hypothetical protein IMCC3317_03850 [Kordia antarctica]|uniref:Uncharacterized protein n=1 Tax=Kordia antarctica TaxID=1218801 RepID=A0A7L4ZEV4_9FLAO|nr:hypothetical protein [Kordia antarctica]QHI35039.1 hypothetical protein IMCC3317_03850 [Kordia antarctica]
MRKILVLLTFIIAFILNVNSQTRIGKFEIEGKHNKLNKKTLASFKNTKTYFIFIESENAGYTKTDYENILNEVWNITPFQVITEDEFYEVAEEKAAFAQFRAFSITRHGKYGSTVFSYHVLDFWLIDKLKKLDTEKKKLKAKRKTVAAIYFTPDINSRQQIVSGKKSISGDLMNYRLGYIKNYLQHINHGLKEKKSFNMFDDFINKDKIGELNNKTLYMSENFIYSYSPWKVEEKEEKMTPEKLFEDYEHTYKVISDKELNNKILANEDFYYLMYNQNVSIKVISVVNGKTGEIIYSTYKSMSYNLKSKNLKELSRKISKN